MKDAGFHDPNLSWRLFRRTLADELLQLFDSYMEFGGGVNFSLPSRSFPDRNKYMAAVHRLRKQGLIARSRGLRTPAITLTAAGKQRIRPEMKPEQYWKKRWSGTWYILMYDVPEKERSYRNALRGFMTRLRMGCLQKSVWISHMDIRPEFADLQEAAGISDFAFLFEARAQLGTDPRQIACQAWWSGELQEKQRSYCDYADKKLRVLVAGKIADNELQALAIEDISAYLAAMEKDPLLPEDIHPPGYYGRTAWNLHSDMTSEIARRL